MEVSHFPSHVLYLHGFRSSPRSAKAQLVGQWVQQHYPHCAWQCPQLPPSPAEAMALIHRLVATWPAAHSVVIGSSLGGFYAAAVAAQYGWRSVLLNPAVDPARDLEKYIGEQTAWHNPEESFYFQPAYIGELRHISQSTLTREAQAPALPPSYALICEGDEVLDWREMHSRYARAQQRILPGNDHAISDFSAHWPAIAQWLGHTSTANMGQ